MASITIRNLEEDLKERLRVRAALKGQSMAQEARDILRHALEDDVVPTHTALGTLVDKRLKKTLKAKESPSDKNLGTAIHGLFEDIGGFTDEELALIPLREPMREPPNFDWIYDTDDRS